MHEQSGGCLSGPAGSKGLFSGPSRSVALLVEPAESKGLSSGPARCIGLFSWPVGSKGFFSGPEGLFSCSEALSSGPAGPSSLLLFSSRSLPKKQPSAS